MFLFFFSSRRRHTRWPRDWSSDVCSSDLTPGLVFGTDYMLGDTVAVEIGAATIVEPVRAVELAWDEFGRTARLTVGDHDQADEQTPAWVKKIRDLDARSEERRVGKERRYRR